MPPLPSPEDIDDPAIEFFQPKDGDPDDYVAVRTRNGTRYAITNTCAANVLGYEAGCMLSGNPEAARRAMSPLRDFIGKYRSKKPRGHPRERFDKVIPVVESLHRQYKLDRDQAMLVGEGGGGAALIPFVSEPTDLHQRFRRTPKSFPPSASRLRWFAKASSA